jgi:HEAT repeat-containing protein 5
VASSWALRSFCFSTPLRLPKLILTVLELLQKDISSLASPNASVNVATRALGHAYGLSALFAVIPERPLYVSYDISAKVLDMATQLLKRASEHDLKVADVEIEIAWTSIASLMALGPNFVKAHLPQLLVLWRNALPKPSSKDTASGTGRTASDWMFLLHVRECALGAILAFLKHNSPTLVTLDVTRRLSSLLSNAVGFANAFQSQEASLDITEQMAQVGGKGVTPMMRESSLRSRAYQCFSILGFSTLTDSTQTTLIQGAIALFASHEGYAGSAMQAAIASSAGNAVNIWQVADEYGYGITSLASVTRKRTTGREGEEGLLIDVVNGNSDSVEKFVEQMVGLSLESILYMKTDYWQYNSPVLTAVEHDTLVLCDLGYSKTLEAWPDAPPSTTAVVDSSIELFSKILPLQEPPALLKTINQLSDAVRTPKMDKNVGRKAAAYVNAVVAILMALRGAMQGTRQAKDNLGRPQVVTALSAFLKVGAHRLDTLGALLRAL